MYMNVIDLSKSVSFVLEDIDIGGQIQYLTCTGPFHSIYMKRIYKYLPLKENFYYYRAQLQCIRKLR